MTPSKLKNFRFDEHYASMLGFLAQSFNVFEAELIRKALDHLDVEYGLELRFAEIFIEQLTEKHGADARLEFRLVHRGETVSAPRHYVPRYIVDAEVLVDGKLDPGLYPQAVDGTIEERIAGVERTIITLQPRAGDDPLYTTGAAGRHPHLYIGELDPASPAALTIKIGDLRKEMQIFGWQRSAPDGLRDGGIVEAPATTATTMIDPATIEWARKAATSIDPKAIEQATRTAAAARRAIAGIDTKTVTAARDAARQAAKIDPKSIEQARKAAAAMKRLKGSP